MANLISTTGPVCPNVTDTPLDNRSRVSTIAGIGNIPLAWKGMLVYCEENGTTYQVTSLKPKRSGLVTIEDYYPDTWVEFGSGGSTPSPSPTPSAIDAGDVTYTSGDTFSNGTVGKELQSLASDIGSKVSGIQVTGEDSIRYPVNGIVTIPAGGGGTGTITGATVGGNPVTASGGVLQFDAYPTVPITSIETSDHTPLAPNNGLVTLPAIPAAPTADTMQYSGSTNYSTGSIGKEVKDLNGSITDLSIKVADLDKDKPSPTPSSSITTVNLASYTTSGSSFTYDVDNKYIYNTKDTTFYQYSEEDNSNTVYYGVFKVIGEDRYLMYSITNNTTFTYTDDYTELTLPENAKKEFALGSVAVVKRVNGEGESWKNGTVNLFCTKQNMPLRNRCKNINFNGSTAWRVLIKSEDGNTIFVYKAKSNGNYEWEINVPRSSTANFNLLDKYFDRPEASSVSFDDTVLHTGYDNIQDVLQVMYSNIQGYVTELKINLKYPNSNPIVNKQVNITVYWHGDVYDLSSQYTPGFSGFKTDNNGNITITIPYGSTYNLSFIELNNDYLTPEPISGTSDLNSITHNVTYTAISNNENVIPTVYIVSGSPSVSLDNKILYIDTIDSSDNVLISHYRKGVLNSVGRLKAVYDENNALLSNTTIEIARGVRYRIYLDLWDSTIPADNQSYVASPLQIYTASKARRLINLWYTNVSVGIFLTIKNTNSEKGYDSYQMFEVDDPTETNSIGVTINNIDYEVYKNGNDIYKKQIGSSTGEPWIEYTNINTILGVGIKTIELESVQGQDSAIDSLGYSSLSIMLLRSVPYSNIAIQQYASPAFPFYDIADGMYVTRLWYNYGEGNTSPAAQYAIDNCTIQLVTENGTINIPAFIPSQLQIKPIIANYEFLVKIFYTINGTLPTALTNDSTLISSSMASNSSGYIPGRYISWTKTNINSGYSIANTATDIIFVYPFR